MGKKGSIFKRDHLLQLLQMTMSLKLEIYFKKQAFILQHYLLSKNKTKIRSKKVKQNSLITE